MTRCNKQDDVNPGNRMTVGAATPFFSMSGYARLPVSYQAKLNAFGLLEGFKAS